MHLLDGADGSGSDQFHDPAIILAGMNLVARLGHQPRLPNLRIQGAHLGEGMGDGLFAVEVTAGGENRRGDDRMGVVRRADHHRVQIVAVQEPAVVADRGRRGKLGLGTGEAGRVDVAQGDDVFPSHPGEVFTPSACDADDPEVQSPIGGDPFPNRGR